MRITPGFWYYDNKSGTINGGTWKPLGGTSGDTPSNLAAGTSSNTDAAAPPIVVTNGIGQLVGTGDAQVAANNGAPLWNANKIQSLPVDVPSANIPVGQVLMTNNATSSGSPATQVSWKPVPNGATMIPYASGSAITGGGLLVGGGSVIGFGSNSAVATWNGGGLSILTSAIGTQYAFTYASPKPGTITNFVVTFTASVALSAGIHAYLYRATMNSTNYTRIADLTISSGLSVGSAQTSTLPLSVSVQPGDAIVLIVGTTVGAYNGYVSGGLYIN